MQRGYLRVLRDKVRATFALVLGPFGCRHSASISAAQGTQTDAAVEALDDARWLLTETEARFCELLDRQEALIIRRDGRGMTTFANRAFCQTFGAALPDIVGTLFRPELLERGEAAAQGDSTSVDVGLYRTANGSAWIRWERHALFSAFGEREIHSVGWDVTAERRATDQLRIERDRAEECSRAKSRFLATMSHEIRTPMNGIIGMSGLLSETDLSNDQRSYVQVIDQSARALLAIINEILDFSKIEAGKLKLAKLPFSLNAAIKSAIDIVALAAKEKGNTISVTIADDVPEVLVGDRDRFGQIILNLLSNAVKFTDGGAIDISVSVLDGRDAGDGSRFYAVSVQDCGVGLSADVMRVMFEEFGQADCDAQGKRNGTGLGLAIAKRLAKAMDGDISAVGAPGEGATFTATLRFGNFEGPKAFLADDTCSEYSVASCAGARILIVEDNDVNALLARAVCERAGASVQVAKDGEAAVTLIQTALDSRLSPFDLILMDVFMPGMDGYETCREVKSLFARRRQSSPPVVALTAQAFEDDRLQCLASGMDDYLAKPFDARQLQAMIAKWVVPEHRRHVS